MKNILLILSVLSLCGCSTLTDNNSTYAEWGSTECYDNFLWNKYVPDTLNRTMCFDFNDDARRFMKDPIKLAFYKKNDSGDLIKVSKDEYELYVNGRLLDDYYIEVGPETSEIKVGIVLTEKARDTEHHWFIKIINDGGLERINDLEISDFYSQGKIIKEITLNKEHIRNPLAVFSLFLFLIILAGCILWLLVIKHILYPCFRVGQITLEGPAPFASVVSLKRCRRLVLSSTPKKQSMLNEMLTGKIKYLINDLWVTDIEFSPRDRTSIRIKHAKDFTIESKILKKNSEYLLENMETKKKTKITIL